MDPVTIEPAPARVARLDLTDFRNYPALSLDLGEGPVVIAGENGSGKTNLLEAVSLLAPGRGLRGSAYSEMARIGGDGGFAVAATLDTAGGAVALGTATQAAAPERRLLRVNGAAAAVASLAEWVAVLWVTPAMDRLFADAASARRRFLDRLTLALVPGHAGETTRYDAAMRARNRLLAEPGVADPDWLAALERQMAHHGSRLAAARLATVAALAEGLAGEAEGPFARAEVALSGGPDDLDEGAIATLLARTRAADAAAGRATAGPHRVDLEVRHAGKGLPAALCSTGEQKALLLGIVLAHARLVAARTGRTPLLLLDEVAAHLDPIRRAALYDRLLAMGGQSWLTGTDPALFAPLEGTGLWVTPSPEAGIRGAP